MRLKHCKDSADIVFKKSKTQAYVPIVFKIANDEQSQASNSLLRQLQSIEREGREGSSTAAGMVMNNASDRVYEEFDPVSDMISEKGSDTLIIYLPGYRKEQMKVQLTTSRVLRISGERPIGDNKWRRFNKEFQIPQNVDTKEITAKFEGGILHIRQPKLIASEEADGEQDKAKQGAEVAKPQAQTQQEAPLSATQQGNTSDGFGTPPSEFHGSRESEAKAEKQEERKEDTIAKKEEHMIPSKVEELKAKREFIEKHKQAVYGSRLFKELRKPKTQKKLAVSVLLPLLLTLLSFYIANMYRSYSGDDQHSILEYEHQEFLRPT